MSLLKRWALLPTLLAALLLMAGFASAVTPEVKDRADYFSKDAVEKANAEILAIKKEFNKDLLIETFPEIPADKKADYDPKDKEKRAAFFLKWAEERAKAADVHGIYILICKSEGHFQIYVDPATEKKEFTSGNRNELRSELLATFKRKEFDHGLLEAVKYVHRTFAANIKRDTATNKKEAPAKSEATATSPFIRDRGEYFSDKAISEATAIIRDIKARHHREVQIDTFRQKPPDEGSFTDWAVKLARARDLDGIQMLLCRQPGHIETVAGNETRKTFTAENISQLDNIMKSRFSDKKYDEGLLEGVRYIQKTFNSHHRTNEAAPSAAPEGHTGVDHRGGTGAVTNWGGLLCMLLVLVGVVWLVVGMIRAFTGMGGGGYGMGGGYGGGGGGFMAGLMGGLFGAMAGNWLYHSMFDSGHGASSAYGGDTGGDTGGSDRPDDGQDYSGGGTDYNDGGGGDTGGGGDYGDSGGGDSGGGGDFGGGGGDFGGGGGDFGGGGGDFGGGGGGDF